MGNHKKSIKEQLTPDILYQLLLKQQLNFAEIGKKYGTSRQRIHQIFKEYKEENKELFENYKKIPSKEELEDKLYNKHFTYTRLCDEYNISFVKLKQILNNYNIEKKYINKILDKTVLEELFVAQGLTDKQIANTFDCSENTVKKLRQDNNILKRK